ncbi:MAG TPA: hypothetical protein PLR24_08080 [Saprospiraceae bacterium]|nr:hypothetical protein [Candidatus Parvibacillus calidus]MBX2937360.1 hypothetical protein [Saprospiraceae bacterium]MBX7178267.1 hypothetical protein [Saprospiraceae bacterium]MCC7149057.1 hypothetical protein [Saprospiraceae bacterium]MCO5284013.1 hypothetical protein [Saprospiraceae bacterium]
MKRFFIYFIELTALPVIVIGTGTGLSSYYTATYGVMSRASHGTSVCIQLIGQERQCSITENAQGQVFSVYRKAVNPLIDLSHHSIIT